MIDRSALCNGIVPWQADRYQLWSLLDMLRFYGASFMAAFSQLGRATGGLVGELFPGVTDDGTILRNAVTDLAKFIEGVPLSSSLKGQAKRLEADLGGESALSLTARERLLLARELHNNLLSELAEQLFLFVPATHKWMFLEPEKWWGERVMAEFGTDAHLDLRDCAQCFALAQWTASVFHAMRILEHGLRRLAIRVGVTFTAPMELENWKNIIDQIEKEIRRQEALPKSPAKSAELQFCSAAAAHFWYIKEAWRNHVSHSRVSYDETAATRIVDHVRDFMLALAA